MGVVLNSGRLTLVAQPVREEEYKEGKWIGWQVVGNAEWGKFMVRGRLSSIMEKLLEFPVDKGFHSLFTKSDQNVHEI